MNDVPSIGERADRGAAPRATPVMAQYLEIKAANPDSLLFYRMGDFYELFFADAEVAARDLGITLTKRGKHLGEDIAMCGVPVHAADGYLQRLIRIGHRVAICEQMEDPTEARKRGSKAVVRRDVVRLVTPGTLTEDNLLEARQHNYLVALTRIKGSGAMALAWADISSGELAVTTTSIDRLGADLARLEPQEVVAPDHLVSDADIRLVLDAMTAPVTPFPAVRFDSINGEVRLKEHFGVAALEGFGDFDKAEVGALGGLLEYILLTQAGQLPHLRHPRRDSPNSFLLIDPASRANLELMRALGGEKHGSLLSVIDMTISAAGSRCLTERLSNPLLQADEVNARLDEVSFLVDSVEVREAIRGRLADMPDIERAMARLTVGRGGPRDLAAIRDGISCAAELADTLAQDFGGLPANLDKARNILAGSGLQLAASLDDALGQDLPLLARDGGFIKPGYSEDLDENRSLRDKTKQVIAGLQGHYAERTGIKTLKVRHNNILGYFIEVSAQQAAAQLQSPEHTGTFIHRQTVASAMRFVTTELASLEERISAAAGKALAIEQEIFNRLVALVVSQRAMLSAIAAAAASVDVASGLAELAVKRRYARPKIDLSMAFDIKSGRHAVVEAMLQDNASGSFVANDCSLSGDGKRIWLLTGPNMAGKSTFLRQNALIVILAQMGSFVPAESAHIGTVDRLFSRVGAADDLARGRSTFMVEMVETAAILNQATERSFVILDEIGRGTATFDGLSIAWATVENLHGVNRCRALFATHYHELTALASRLDRLANATVKVREWEDEIIFLHEVVPGVADRSYGIHVARLAGLPSTVVARAEDVLERLERGDARTARKALIDDLPLFSAAAPRRDGTTPGQASALDKRLAAVIPDELSPRDALALIYELKALQAAKT